MEKIYIGLDVHKISISVALAEDERGGEVRFLGEIENTTKAISNLLTKLSKKYEVLDFCYEAGCCGYNIYRQIIEAGHMCMVVAPSRIPMASGDRVKTDRRDAQRLAILHRAGDLTRVWVPDKEHEAMRDLVRARMDAMSYLMRARQQLLAFLLRHNRVYESGKQYWTYRHRHWLAKQQFDEPAQNIVFQDYVEAVWAGLERREALSRQIEELVPQNIMENLEQAQKIAKLNDEFRSLITSREHERLGVAVMTRAVQSLRAEQQMKLLEMVRDFKDFSEGNDPYQEHDFESIPLKGEAYYWKIDYYAPDLIHASEDPSDPDKTYRVLTIMHSSEY